jgi:arylsulfatase
MKFLPPLYVEGAKQITHKDIEGPFYSSTYFADRMVGFLSERDKKKPFFSYLPFTAPHCELPSARARWSQLTSRASSGARRRGRQVQGPV